MVKIAHAGNRGGGGFFDARCWLGREGCPTLSG